MKSLDPRVTRLPAEYEGKVTAKAPLDQFGTYEVFVQAREGKPFQHEGIVHAPNLEMAYVLAKEAFTRRFTCVSLYVVDTRDVYVSPMTEHDANAYDQVEDAGGSGAEESFEVFHLLKRGKQHQHVGTVSASNAAHAMSRAKETLRDDKLVFNIWAIPTAQIRFTQPGDLDLWTTLPEKKFRDAINYKGGDKLKEFLERQKHK
ncbi:MAG: phenylacetic acid degradation b [Cyclobacteriaceae bacterium]